MSTFDDRVTIATPEGVELELVLAGLGSRFMAALLDVVIQLGAIFALAIVFAPVGDSGYVVAAYFIAVFVVLFAYDIVLETWNRGRTVGKLAAGLRVVRTGGEPVGFLTAAVRNFLRLADFLPAFYVVGVITILVTSRNQRLGDLAAGTLVVRERRPAVMPAAKYLPPAPADAPFLEWDVSGVTADDLATLRQFLDRRLALQPAARAHLATDLAARVRPKVVGAPDGWHPESFLEAVVAAKTSRG
ncbi:MAG TPA: RDD family protein [Acidimicrobiia bacterium]|nr:RDD family protein [Acidimicrobiia bacterium]